MKCKNCEHFRAERGEIGHCVLHRFPTGKELNEPCVPDTPGDRAAIAFLVAVALYFTWHLVGAFL